MITFCVDNERISYFDNVAKRLIILMGHSGTVPGAIQAPSIHEALEQLQQGLGQAAAVQPDDEGEDSETNITLAKRAVPLIGLLQAAERKNCDLLWEVGS